MLGRGKGKGEEMGEAGIACTVGRRDAAMLEEELAGLVHHSVMHRVDLDDGVAVWMGWDGSVGEGLLWRAQCS